MAKCDICGKGVAFGIKVSHSHRRSNRAWKANVRTVRALVNPREYTFAQAACVQTRLQEPFDAMRSTAPLF